MDVLRTNPPTVGQISPCPAIELYLLRPLVTGSTVTTNTNLSDELGPFNLNCRGKNLSKIVFIISIDVK